MRKALTILILFSNLAFLFSQSSLVSDKKIEILGDVSTTILCSTTLEFNENSLIVGTQNYTFTGVEYLSMADVYKCEYSTVMVCYDVDHSVKEVWVSDRKRITRFFIKKPQNF